MKINEKQLRNIISESIKKVLKESFDEDYRIIFIEDLGSIERYDELSKIFPIYVLGPNDYNKEDNEVIVNGKPSFYASENTNYFADPSGNKTPREGDLVFEVGSSLCLYRKGLNFPTGECGYYDALIGTIPEIKKAFLEFREEYLRDYGVDVANIK